MSKITAVFSRCRREGRKAFIPFIAAGDPDLQTTLQALQVLDQAGADIIELGIPFSDPIADGPIIQASYQRALTGGASLEKTLAGLERTRLQAPLLLFTYLNPVLQLALQGQEAEQPGRLQNGLRRLAARAVAAGVGGVLISDLTPEEAAGYRPPFQSEGMDTIFLVAPTTTEARLRRIVPCCSGFLYLIARTGVTGKRTVLGDSVKGQVERIRRHSALPVALGFGIRTPEDLRQGALLADGVVVGSAIVETLQGMVGSSNWQTGFREYICEFVGAARN